MGVPVRVKPQEAAGSIKKGQALLVCAYDSDEKFDMFHLDGAIPLSEFKSRLPSLPKEQEVIFYCA
jgi:rhodanese-related sulfurtransferase